MVNKHMFKDFFTISFKNMSQRRTRSWLTMVGIFIGIAAVVALISLGEGLQGAINAEFEELGMDKIFIAPAGSLFGAGGVDSLTEDDIELVAKVRGVDASAGYFMTTAKVEWEDELWWPMVIGMPTDEEQMDLMMELFPFDKGKKLEDGMKYKAMTGYHYATHPAFDDPLLIGDEVLINDKSFDVIGSFEEVGNNNDDRIIVLPIDTARDLLNVPERIDSIMVKVKPDEDVDEVTERIEEAMRKDRDLKEGNEDFTVQTFKDVIESFLVILDIVTAVLVGIAAISLLIGSIGIMNTMYTAVLERTKEIGIMKAIGGTNNDVLTLFLIESGMLGLAGGIVGFGLGAGISSLTAYLAQTVGGFEYLEAHFPIWLIIGSLVFSFLVGVIAGVFPARQAARKNPVDSLRYE